MFIQYRDTIGTLHTTNSNHIVDITHGKSGGLALYMSSEGMMILVPPEEAHKLDALANTEISPDIVGEFGMIKVRTES